MSLLKLAQGFDAGDQPDALNVRNEIMTIPEGSNRQGITLNPISIKDNLTTIENLLSNVPNGMSIFGSVTYAKNLVGGATNSLIPNLLAALYTIEPGQTLATGAKDVNDLIGGTIIVSDLKNIVLPSLNGFWITTGGIGTLPSTIITNINGMSTNLGVISTLVDGSSAGVIPTKLKNQLGRINTVNTNFNDAISTEISIIGGTPLNIHAGLNTIYTTIGGPSGVITIDLNTELTSLTTLNTKVGGNIPTNTLFGYTGAISTAIDSSNTQAHQFRRQGQSPEIGGVCMLSEGRIGGGKRITSRTCQRQDGRRRSMFRIIAHASRFISTDG